MFGVDKGDQLRARGGGFGSKAHFKKWYKKILLGLFDVFLLNAYVLYNAVADIRRQRGERRMQNLLHQEVATYIAQCMLDYQDGRADPPTPEIVRERKRIRDVIADAKHKPLCQDNTKKKNKAKCAVCRLESSLSGGSKAGLKRNLCRCSECNVTVHNYIVDDPARKLQAMECFQGMTCFEIMHVPKDHEGYGLWGFTGKENEPAIAQRTHPLYRKLRRLYGKPETIPTAPKGKSCQTEDENDK
jgi:hypothetical protein